MMNQVLARGEDGEIMSVINNYIFMAVVKLLYAYEKKTC